MRKLTAAEVTFEVTIEAEDTPVRGNLIASDDPDADRLDEEDVLHRLNRGEVEAWCCVVVTATWQAPDGAEYTGRDTLGGCSLTEHYTAEIAAKEHGMREQALDDLNQRLASKVVKAKQLVRALR